MPDRRPIDVVIDRLADHGPRPSGDSGRQWECRCPAHEDRAASLAVGVNNADVVLLKCYAGCTTGEVVAALGLEAKDLFPAREKRKQPPGVTVNALAFEKRIPAEFLRSYCRLADGTWFAEGTEHRAVKIPYLGADGAELFVRSRFAASAKAGSRQPKGTKLQLYGLWLLEEFRRRGGPLVVVEGESDCWALWLHKVNAVGVPGAEAARVLADLDPATLAGFDRVLVWREPDRAGEGFPDRVGAWLQGGGFAGAVDVVSAPGAKDPADVQARYGAEFPGRWAEVVAAAVPWVPPAGAAAPAAGSLPQTVRRAEAALRQTGVCDWGEFELTDAGNAGRMEKLHGADLRYVGRWGQWLAWDGRRWRQDDTGEAHRRALQTVWSLALEAQLAPGRSGMQECLTWFARSQAARSLAATVQLARHLGRIPVGHDELDRRPMLLNCPGQMVDLLAGGPTPHRREDLLLSMCPTEYDPAAACPAWEQFLARVFPADPADPARGGNVGLIRFVQRYLGYCLSGSTREQVMAIFWGSGANGKSTLLNTVQEVVGPDYAMQAPDGFLMARHSDQHPTELADLFGKRLVVVSETQQNRRLDEALVKRLTGGEPIRARRMREDYWEFPPTHKLVLCTNHRPQIRGNDPAIWRRVLLVPFLVRFWNPSKKGETGPDHLRQDKELGAKLLAERKGILAWLVRGCIDWQREGLEQPPEVCEATEEYRGEEDTLGRFLAEVYARVEHGGCILADVGRDYVRWCEANGERANLSTRAMAAELRARSFTVRAGTGNRQTVYGLAPREPAHDPDRIPY